MIVRHAQVLEQAEEPFGTKLLRTEHAARNVPFLPEECQVLFAAGEGGCTGLASEECVVVYKDQLIWTSGRSVRKRFTASSDILQVCWANFGGAASRAGDKHAKCHSSSSSNRAKPAAAEAPRRRSSTGTAPNSSWQQRTSSLSTWLPGQDPAAAQTPEQHGLLGPPFGAAGASDQGKVNNTGLSPSHLPSWWTNTAYTASTQSVGGSKHTPRHMPGAVSTSAGAGGAGMATPEGLQTPVDVPAVSGAGGGDTASSNSGNSNLCRSRTPSAVSEAALCLLLRTSITCVFATGELLQCPLLQPCQALWPLPTGVILAGPFEAFASVLTHPLEEPLPVVADCSLSTAAAAGRGTSVSISTPAAYTGWSQERVVWSSRQLPYVATHNEDRGRLSIWHIRTQPAGTHAIGSAYDLPALSPFGLGPMRTPVATAAATAASNLPTFGSVNSAAAAAAGGQTVGVGSAGGFGSAAAAAAAAGYAGGPAAYSGSMLGMLASGGVTPWSGPGSFARMSVGNSTIKRSSLRSPAGRLPASVFSATPNPQNPITGVLGAMGPLRPSFSNTTAAQQALLLPGPDPSLLFKLIGRQELAGGLVPDGAVLVTDACGQPLLCVLCSAAQQLLAFQLPGADDTSSLVVKPSFSTPALAAVPVSTGAYAAQALASSSSSSSSCAVTARRIVDLLILQPGGRLLLHRGADPLVVVQAQLPMGRMQSLQQKLVMAALARQHTQQQQQQRQQQGSPPDGGAGRQGVCGPYGYECRSMSDGEDGCDMMMAETPTQPAREPPAAAAAAAGAAPGGQARICGLGSAALDRFDMQLQLGAARTPLRMRLGISWLPGLPTQMLQALGEVLDSPCFNRLLGACLTQTGACCGELHAEWTAIAAVVLAWALQPDCLQDIACSSTSTSTGAGPQDTQQQQQQQQTVAGGIAPTPQPNLTAAMSDSDDDMDMATPVAAAATPMCTPQQQQQQQTPGSDMAMSEAMSMSVDPATPATQRGPSRFQQAASGTPMSTSNTPMSVSSKTVSRLRHQSSYRQGFGHQEQQQQQDAGVLDSRQGLAMSGVDVQEVFPATGAAAAAATRVPVTGQQASAVEAAAVAAAQRSFGQLQLPHAAQIDGGAEAVTPGTIDHQQAWQQLLQSPETNQLLLQLPSLRVRSQPVASAAAVGQASTSNAAQQQQQQELNQAATQLAVPTASSTQQQQQQHRRQVGLVLLALHSVYQDCKLSRLRLHLLQYLGPVVWLLACWLGCPLYQDHYEREAAPTGLQAAATAYLTAAEALLASVGCSRPNSVSSSSSGESGDNSAFQPQKHLAVLSGLHAAGEAVQQQQQQQQQRQQQQGTDVEQLLQQPPGDILRCLSLLLSASQQYQQYMPYLVSIRSTSVLQSLQLLQVYRVLAAGASRCATAIATAAAEAVTGPGGLQHVAASGGVSWLGGAAGSQQQAALVCELHHGLVQCSQQLVLLLVEQGWDVLALDQLPIGVGVPIKEVLARCRGNPPVGWQVMAYALIGREDIAATLASNNSTPAAMCTTGVSVTTPAPAPSKGRTPSQQQHQHFEPGAVVFRQHQHHTQHLLLPYEQRLLLPSGGFLTGQQHHQRLPSAAAADAGHAAGRRGSSRTAPSRGLRSTGAPAGSSTAAMPAAGTAASAAVGAAAAGKGAGQGGEVVPIDGMEGLVNGVSALRFSRDDRLAEARSLLGTNMPVLMSAAASENDPELAAKQQASLFAAAMRTMALPLGRGALTLGLAEPLPGEHVVVPLLCLSGVVPGPAGDSGPNNGRVLVNLDLTNAQPAAGGGAAAEVTAWCEFHNGVAAGLKIVPCRSRRKQQRQQQQSDGGAAGSVEAAGSGMASSRDGSGAASLSESWLPHSKPAVPNYAHAGVLLALGLHGHLDRLCWTDLYRYLSDQHDATTIAVLLGMSAACRGTADSTVARMLFLHLPARHPNTFPEIELSPHVQAASLLGLGLLYQGSCHRLMTETVLEEMCRTPGVNPHAAAVPGSGADGGAGGTGASLSALMSVTYDREGYALAAGFGLGLICLGQGRNAPGLADLHLEDRLRSLMDAQVQPHTLAHKPKAATDTNKPSNSSSLAGLGPPARNLLDHVLGPGVVPWSLEAGDDPTGHAAAAAAASGGIKVDADQMQQYGISQVVLEGPVVNTAVTGPAAAMALMMMYLKTGDPDVASRFKVPDTAYALDHMRPDMVLLMALGRALVLWDSIEPTEEWLRGQLSPLLDHHIQTILDNQALPPAAAAAGGSVGSNGVSGSKGSRQQQAAMDWGAVGLAHVNAMTGACFAVGLRFAGTCSAQAENLLRGQLLALLSAKARAPGGSTSSAVATATAAVAAGVTNPTNPVSYSIAYLPPSAACVGQLDKSALESAIVVVLLSLSMVMAGSGHLPTFRIIQMLSRRAAAPLRPPGQSAATPEGQPGGPIAAILGGAGVGTNSLNYGHHLAVSLAAGLLFLSGGRSSLSTSNEAIAALVIALYPVWPCTPTDQRCHLQAFRHLYALAAEPRYLEAIDVHSRRQVVLPLSVTTCTEGLAGAAAAAHHAAQQQRLQQQQQRRSVLKQWQDPTATAGLHAGAGLAAGVMTALPGQEQQQESGGDAMLWSPRSTDSAGTETGTPAVHQQQQQMLPSPVFAKGTAAAGNAQQSDRAGSLPPTPAVPGLPPISPQGGSEAAGASAAGDAAAAAAGGTAAHAGNVNTSSEQPKHTASLRLQAPCLLPEHKYVQSLRVCGPRYWPVDLVAGPSSSSSGDDQGGVQQYLQHRICVKKKAGSLSYTDDHTGVKSLLFKAFYAGGSDSMLAATSAGTAESADRDDDVSTDGANVQMGVSSSRKAPQHSFDITHLCQTFAADPQIQAFAQVLQAANAAAAAAAAGTSTAVSRSARLLSFCTGALYECIVQEKTSALPAYLQLHSVVSKVCAQAAAVAGMAAGPQQSQAPTQLTLADSGNLRCVLGGSSPVGAGLLLQDLMMILSYYSSSGAVAAGMCGSALHSGVMVEPAGSPGQQHEVDVLMWQPLLQPGFCSSLYATLMRFWRAAGVLPGGWPSSNDAEGSSGSLAKPSDVAGCSMLASYIRAGKMQAAAESTTARHLIQPQQQLLAGCLAALRVPAGVQLQDLRAEVLKQQEQGEDHGAAAVLQLLTSTNHNISQEAPPGALLELAAALQAAL